MVDPKKAAAASDNPGDVSAAGSGLGVPASSDDDPGPGQGSQGDGTPLLQRIRRDRADLEAKIDKLRSYIKASSDMMVKLKDMPDMRERYESLAATRADLVQNAVNLQQLLHKLQQSENRAASLADRERALAAETGARNQSDLVELSRELPPEEVAELDPEDRAMYEKKRDLLKRINQSQEKLRAMEVEQQRLRLMKESVEWKLAEARTSRLSIQERAEDLMHDMPGGVHPAAAATNWESTTSAADRSALEQLDGRLAALLQLPVEQLNSEEGDQLRQRLQQLQLRRRQLDELSEQLEVVRAEAEHPQPEQEGAAAAEEDQQEQQEQQEQQQQQGEEFLRSHAAAMSVQRQRLQQLEDSVADIRETLAQSGQHQQDHEQRRSQLEQEQEQFMEQEHRLQERTQQLEASREELARLRRLMTAVEEAHGSGRRLCDAVPHQLTELLASVRQLDAEDAANAGDSQTQASEYVAMLQRIQQSVDSLGVMHLNQ